ncbi:ABC transporter substrate-binding protein [Roseomonas stagni]|uniref:ABC transporter substrate-binding protein n=1 Tax=Falsiroseomonas algicola TaxID=2716930 RepID=A0A6M1LW85_9PROT|nr:ABC transporter substrate-binding protein [Falsiroseomonas algicola]NGM24279.1 ABC transporter substrate-binding protein [Falsiroseomonas algicola]
MIRRRDLFALGAGMAIAAPAVAQNSRATTLRMVPQANLSVLDPVFTTATVTGNHGFYVFDTLYGVDANLRPTPQMAEGHEVSADGLTWRIKLREGLRFHDGEPVRATDCIASIRRWCAREPFGQLLARQAEEWIAADDRTMVIRLRRPFPLMLDALAKPDAASPFIMPARLAATDPARAVTEMIGSGPYRFIANEFNSGSRVVYEKFDGYIPRQETPTWTSGAKVAHFRRIEWHILPDPATAAAALQAGEVDWWERPHPDLQQLLARSRDVRREVTDPTGRMAVMRMNNLHAPFDDVRIRRAVRLSVAQDEYMRASRGDNTQDWSVGRSLWPRHTPYFEDLGADMMPGDLDRARAALREAGYANQKVVIINPTDFPDIGPLGQVTADRLKRAGMNVELSESDWGTVVQRRSNREGVDRGGWSILHTTGGASAWANPATSFLVRGQGTNGWFGWWKSDRAEDLAEAWLNAPTEERQKALASELGKLALDEAAFVPLGQFVIRTAFRRDITGILPGSSPYPWNVRRG